MLTVACFLWRRQKDCGIPHVVNYEAAHVNKLQRMVAKHYAKPHRFVCVTDMPAGVKAEVIPLWDKCRNLGRCFNRLFIFDGSMRDVLGERFVAVDLDCVVTKDLTPVFERQEDFVINSYKGWKPTDPDQFYNGSMMLMTAGARQKVWDEFNPLTTPALLASRKDVIGSDQAWIKVCLGKGEARFTRADGVVEALHVQHRLPMNARMVFFSGRRDPSLYEWPWIREYYQ